MEPQTLYEIRIQGHLSQGWAAWFEGFTLDYDGNGDTVLTGTIVDQAALHGALMRIRDLGIPLLSVNRIPTEQEKTH
ncbi:MAG: hypothetical protein JXB35_05645 [Anaerolineae bacterium]|nr:hypothetical protein [Anaerolineae bacterium]